MKEFTHNIIDFDAKHIWHPYTCLPSKSPIYHVVKTQGIYIELSDGKQLVDGMASWWAAIHGYNHPRLSAALTKQADVMPHIMFGGLTHTPAVELAHKLLTMTAEPLSAVFFSDSGSVAVEVAIKMAIQYWFALGQSNKHRLLTVRGGYHGDTFGAMAVCDPVNGMHTMFTGLLAQHLFADLPRCSSSKEKTSADCAGIAALIEQHQNEIAAVILEPIVQGAGGMRFYCPEYLQTIRALCDQYQVLLIFDEIATGFGRTGSLFAYQQADVIPDILCLGKALTGGYMSLAATLTQEKIAHAISHNDQVFMHGPTFMANPLACSVACASIDLLLESPWQARVAAIEKQLQQELAACADLAIVKQVRVHGAIGVVELNQSIDLAWLQAQFVEKGVWIRPFGRLVYIMPAYVIPAAALSQLTTAIYNSLEKYCTEKQ